MNREVEFRGISTRTGNLVYGNYFHNFRKGEGFNIIPFDTNEWIEVVPETIGQYTGRGDINGKKIFDGDNVEYTLTHDSSNHKINGTIEWYRYAWRLNRVWLLTEVNTIEVIGNIHQKKELLS